MTGTPGLRMPAFLSSDLSEGLAEVLLVIEADRRDRRHQRLDHIGRIKPPAEANLADRDLHRRPAEQLKGDSSGDFKKCRMRVHPVIAQSIDHGSHVGNDGSERLAAERAVRR